MRFAKCKSLRVSFVGKAIHDRSPRIPQPHHLRTFVERFTGSIVDRLPDHFHIVVSIHLDNLRVPTRYQQAKERERRSMIVFRRLLDEMGQHMRLQMVDLDHRNVQRSRQTFGKRSSDQQRPHQTRPTGESNGTQFGFIDTGTLDRFGNHRNNVLLMCAGSQFGNNTAVGFVNSLTGNYIRQHHAVAYYR